jgi:hypothetical protein
MRQSGMSLYEVINVSSVDGKIIKWKREILDIYMQYRMHLVPPNLCTKEVLQKIVDVGHVNPI